MKKIFVISGISFAVILFIFLESSAFKSKTAALVRVSEVSNEYIVVENLNKEKTTIKIPNGITKLIEVNEEYFVEYEYSKITSPKLVSIEPAE
ncbi:hypothetical protein [Brevibacillus fortis]|uniref:hypothetical protein n=1 Tax=Brevibacillus fortis TaxID=2126352 RepID=UPI0038FC6EBA